MYKGHLKNHFSDDLKTLKVNRITPATVEAFISGCIARKVHLSTIRKLIITFNQVMNYAVRHRYIIYNPVRDAERPRGKGKVSTPKIKVLKPGQVKAFLDAVEDPKFKTLFMLAILSGARQGEILGLKWTDVDWQANQIHIQRTYNNGAWYAPKSQYSNRRIDLGPAMMKELKKWKLAGKPNTLDLIFPDTRGEAMNHSNLLRKHFWPALKAAKVPKIRFHDLRHTYASLLIDQGENIKYIQSQLGHSNPTVTLNIYAHLFESSNQEAPKKLEKTVLQGTGHKMVTIGNLAEGTEGLTT